MSRTERTEEMNKEGLTFERWCAAARTGERKSPAREGWLRKAWKAGEDPTEWAADVAATIQKINAR